MNVGLVGCGNISEIYLNASKRFEAIRIVACADRLPERAEEKAEAHGIRAMPVDALINDPDIPIILNLTIPAAHHEIAMAALRAGKHVHNEKPLAITLAEGEEIMALAEEKGLRVGCAPDTFLGAGLQTCRKLVDDGWLGRPVAATAFFMCPGHESWHPDPAFYYQHGGGPVFDMGPYYITALVHLLGPVKRVVGSTATTYPTRTITSEAKYGEVVEVEVPTHASASLEFANGAIATVIMSFDVVAHCNPCLELHGTEGSMQVPDPNTFGGPVRVFRRHGAWGEVPLLYPHAEQSRSIGVADLAAGLALDRPHRASGALGLHVLEIMHAIVTAGEKGRRVKISHKVRQPDPLPLGIRPGTVDA
jgi:predicted dehydrogenase